MGTPKRFFQSLKLEKLVVWSSLSRFGNSPLAKAALLAPIVAIFVQLNDVYLAQTFGFQNAIWLYWSLISIGVGQILFSLKCPKSIRTYGNDQERFVLEAKASWTMERLGEASYDKLRHFIGKDGLLSIDGRVLELSDDQGIRSFYAEKSKSLADNVRADLLRGIPELRLILMGKIGVRGRVANAAAALQWIVSHFPNSIYPRKRDLDKNGLLIELSRFAVQIQESRNKVGQDNQNSSWVVPALNCRYELDNQKNKLFRWAVAGFYVSGFLYFAWRALASLASMTDATIKAIF